MGVGVGVEREGRAAPAQGVRAPVDGPPALVGSKGGNWLK